MFGNKYQHQIIETDFSSGWLTHTLLSHSMSRSKIIWRLLVTRQKRALDCTVSTALKCTHLWIPTQLHVASGVCHNELLLISEHSTGSYVRKQVCGQEVWCQEWPRSQANVSRASYLPICIPLIITRQAICRFASP